MIKMFLRYIHERYDSDKYPIIVTENGISGRNGTDKNPELNDQWRIATGLKFILSQKFSIKRKKNKKNLKSKKKPEKIIIINILVKWGKP